MIDFEFIVEEKSRKQDQKYIFHEQLVTQNLMKTLTDDDRHVGYAGNYHRITGGRYGNTNRDMRRKT